MTGTIMQPFRNQDSNELYSTVNPNCCIAQNVLTASLLRQHANTSLRHILKANESVFPLLECNDPGVFGSRLDLHLHCGGDVVRLEIATKGRAMNEATNAFMTHKVIIWQNSDGWCWQESTEIVVYRGFETQYHAKLHAIDILEWDDKLIKIDWLQERSA